MKFVLNFALIQGLKNSCCGMMFNSRGFKEAAKGKAAELEDSLVEASQNGKLPIVMDTSPCLAQLKGSLSTSALKYALTLEFQMFSHASLLYPFRTCKTP